MRMKKFLLTFVAVLSVAWGAHAQNIEFKLGTASWNIEDGKVFESIEDLNAEGILLTYEGTPEYTLTPLNLLQVTYDLYIDDAEEPLKETASARGSLIVGFGYSFAEGHKYKIVTTSATMVAVNLATYSAETIAENTDAYTISFSIKAPELVKTIDVEGTMSLSITDQEAELTFAQVDADAIKEALGIESISEATVYGLNVNGSYNPYYVDPCDGWRDADGEYTLYYSRDGYDVRNMFGHGPSYPAVYCVKLTENADSVLFYYYDAWTKYDPDAPESVPGSGAGTGTTGGTSTDDAPYQPATSYNSIVWDWYDEEGDSIIQYRRSYRVDEGSDYKANFAIIANKKYVLINATLHFVSQEDYAAYLAEKNTKKYEGFVASGLTMLQNPGTPLATSTEEQTVTIKNMGSEGLVDITFSGFKFPMLGTPTGEQTISNVAVETLEDGSIAYAAGNFTVGIQMGMMTSNYNGSLKGVQVSAEEAPVLVLTLSQSTAVTAVFNATEELATAALTKEYETITAIDAPQFVGQGVTEIYTLNGARLSSLQKGFNLVKYADGTVKKVLVK